MNMYVNINLFNHAGNQEVGPEGVIIMHDTLCVAAVQGEYQNTGCCRAGPESSPLFHSNLVTHTFVFGTRSTYH